MFHKSGISDEVGFLFFHKSSDFKLNGFDDILIRKLIECVKVLSKTEIEIYFKGGYAVRAEVEK